MKWPIRGQDTFPSRSDLFIKKYFIHFKFTEVELRHQRGSERPRISKYNLLKTNWPQNLRAPDRILQKINRGAGGSRQESHVHYWAIFIYYIFSDCSRFLIFCLRHYYIVFRDSQFIIQTCRMKKNFAKREGIKMLKF